MKVNLVSGVGTPEYKSWTAMKHRCNCETKDDYKYYGGRGISVCDRWNESFHCFLNDMGLRPSKLHTLDRIDVNGNYEPSNCRWATRKEQANNRGNTIHIEYMGETKSLADWCRVLEINFTTAYIRLMRMGYIFSDEVFAKRDRRVSVSNDTVIQIRSMASNGLSYSEIGRQLKMNVTTVRVIAVGERRKLLLNEK